MTEKSLPSAIQKHRYSDKVLLFELKDGYSINELLGRYPMAAAPRNPNRGPTVAQFQDSENQFIVRGYKWVSYSFNSEQETVVLCDATGVVEILNKFVKSDVQLYNYPESKYIPQNVDKLHLEGGLEAKSEPWVEN
jgi:hypothetical protein